MTKNVLDYNPHVYDHSASVTWRPSVDLLILLHSRPKVLVSSTAISSFSYNMVYEGYGGRSRRLKHV